MRSRMIEAARGGERWDVVVVGGGATGLGTAVDAAARGYRTLLVEARDFAQGTSSRSTKLVHGGVRYLARGQVGLVHEALRERGLLRANAPHLVRSREFLVPSYRRFELLKYGIGLKAYDLLAGDRGFGASRRVGAGEATGLVPTLKGDGLLGGIAYRDGQFDDARLAIALLRTFVDLGGIALNRAPVVGVVREGGRVVGVEAIDEESGGLLRVEARVVVNAGGVFADEVRRLEDPGTPSLIRASRGSHLVLDRSVLPGEAALMVPKTDDGRVLFLIPWLGRVLLGTTDVAVEGTQVEPRPSAEEVAYLLDHAGRYLARAPRRDEVRSTFAGLRPLLGRGGGPTSRLSREHAVMTSGGGMVTITGGKWTTYRVMAADAVDRAATVGGLPKRPSTTETLRLRGASDAPVGGPLSGYGADAPEVEALLRSRPGWDGPLHPDLPYRVGEVAWAARFELACRVEDVLARRTRALLLDAKATVEAAPRVAEILAGELGRDDAWRREEVRRFEALAEAYLVGPS
ncbi:glycerol-3-phosphate dehydrogenase/oxidase [Tautonia plasticadhaerens]|uniref:Aerobic glycerol-3-phosphate dehydrogenase n=1 Tax=Tautonia plasticadhaerens TaxID=2527974 RepID=A0A518H0J4_9BACT|nr:glycerol-3-phosphate dehydrogenase/oxidase [Tautonia plasticadhaerens]QDV34359.1 Aerobic glycerol-3-phosphate dehydrogenase [Tautonia plasticadhaerens]